jgi:hypothetical protein
MSSTLFVEHMFNTYIAILTGSPQNHPGRFVALSMLLTVATIVSFRRSTTTFVVGCRALCADDAPFNHIVLCELRHSAFASTVGVERPQLQVGDAFCLHLDLLDSNCCTILGGDRGYPHVPAEVIHE